MLMRLQQICFSKIADGKVKWYNHPEKQFGIFIFFLVVFLIKLNIHKYTTQSSNCTSGHSSQRNEILHPHKNLYTNIHSSFICNSPKLEPIQMSFKWVNG